MLYLWYMAAVLKLDFRRKRIWTILHLGEAIYIPTKFRENILIGGKDTPKTKFDTGFLAAEFYFRFQFCQLSSFGDLPVYIQNFLKSLNALLSYCDSTFSLHTLYLETCRHAELDLWDTSNFLLVNNTNYIITLFCNIANYWSKFAFYKGYL